VNDRRTRQRSQQRTGADRFVVGMCYDDDDAHVAPIDQPLEQPFGNGCG
jgi:hypothetical protein